MSQIESERGGKASRTTAITMWHPTQRGGDQTGVRRYEDSLANQLAERYNISRVRRPPGTVRGSTPVSMALDYRGGDADVVHATYETAAIPALLWNPDRLIISSHGPIPIRYPATVQDRITDTLWRAVPTALKRADHVIANSQFTKRELVDVFGLDPAKITVVYLGVDHNRFQPVEPGNIRSPFAKYAGRPTILVLSSTLPQKRMDLVVEAVENVTSQRADAVLLKAGYGEALDTAIGHNVGWVPEALLPDLYSAADVLLHPSEYESFGLPVLEAMACGTPVVASDATAIPEVVGDAGTLVDPHAADASDRFAAAVLDRLGSGRVGGVRDRSQQFSWEQTARETADVYEEVA